MDNSKVNLKALTPGEVELVKWQFRLHGDFKKALWEAIARADINNLMALGMGFPDEVAAFNRFANESGYWEDVKRRANIVD